MRLSAAKSESNAQNVDMNRHIMMQYIILDLYIDTL